MFARTFRTRIVGARVVVAAVARRTRARAAGASVIHGATVPVITGIRVVRVSAGTPGTVIVRARVVVIAVVVGGTFYGVDVERDVSDCAVVSGYSDPVGVT